MRRPTGEQPVVQRNGLGTHSLTHSLTRTGEKQGREKERREKEGREENMYASGGRTDGRGRTLASNGNARSAGAGAGADGLLPAGRLDTMATTMPFVATLRRNSQPTYHLRVASVE